MLTGLIGAIIGGVLALAGGWLGFRWQEERQARNVASAMLAELSVSQDIVENDGVAAFYNQLLDHLKETGTIRDRQALADLFDNNAQETLPVFYSMAPSLGLLPRLLGSDLVEYHARIIGLQKTVFRLVGRHDLDRETVKLLAHSIQGQFEQTTALRKHIMVGLSTCADRSIRLIHMRSERLLDSEEVAPATTSPVPDEDEEAPKMFSADAEARP